MRAERGRLALLDFGLMAEIGVKEREGMVSEKQSSSRKLATLHPRPVLSSRQMFKTVHRFLFLLFSRHRAHFFFWGGGAILLFVCFVFLLLSREKVGALIHTANRDYKALIEDLIALEVLPPDTDRSQVRDTRHSRSCWRHRISIDALLLRHRHRSFETDDL